MLDKDVKSHNFTNGKARVLGNRLEMLSVILLFRKTTERLFAFHSRCVQHKHLKPMFYKVIARAKYTIVLTRTNCPEYSEYNRVIETETHL